MSDKIDSEEEKVGILTFDIRGSDIKAVFS